MRIIGCDLHARQQTLAMLDTGTGEVVTRTLMHAGNEVREFYSHLPRPVLVGIAPPGNVKAQFTPEPWTISRTVLRVRGLYRETKLLELRAAQLFSVALFEQVL